MKIHSDNFKETIKSLGKMQDVRITYTLNNKQFILDGENINSATPNYEASLLKSVMKVLDLDSNTDIPLGTEIKFEYGLLVNGVYEYLDYGNYIVYSSEKQEDTLSYKIKCYDKMLYAMKDYEHIEVNYPCKIKKFLTELCKKIGLEFKDSTFANQDREFANELFMTINEDGTYSSMGYTYRDVLDQIAETTGGCICITLDDKVEVRYVNELYNRKGATGNPIHITDSIESELTITRINGNQYQATREGYNLLNNTLQSQTINGLKVTVNEDKSVKVVGTATDATPLIFDQSKATLPAGTYILKDCGTYIESEENHGGWNSGETRTFTAEATLSGSGFYKYYAMGEVVNETLYPILVAGSELKPYEQYGAMPSPDYPSKIKTVGDNLNLLDINKTTYDSTINLQKEGEYLKGNNLNVIRIGTLYNSMPQIEEHLKSGIYTISYEVEANTNVTIKNLFLCMIYEDDTQENIVSRKSYSLEKGTKQKVFWTINVQKNAKKIGIVSYLSDSCDVILSSVKLEKGENVTPYSQYGMGSVKIDVVNNDNTKSQSLIMPIQQEMLEGDYIADVEHHEWVKIVLNGNEDIRIREAANSKKIFGIAVEKEPIYTSGAEFKNIYCNMATASSRDTLFNTKTLNLISYGSANKYYNDIVFSFVETKNMTVDEFKAWVKNKYDAGTPIIVYYKLAEPINLELTSEQKTVQDTKLYTYKNVTNIAVSDELASLVITYFSSSKETINEEYISDTNVNFGEKYRANQFNCACKSRRK